MRGSSVFRVLCSGLFMKRPVKALLLCWLMVVGSWSLVTGQDIHFSQFNFSPLNQNPANTNLFDGDYRFVGNYKNQWPTVPVRYNTLSLSGEANFVTLKNNDKVGGGLLLFFDQAGDSHFTSLNADLSFSYIKALDKNAHHFLSLGIALGLINRSFDYSRLSFDNQWNGDVFNSGVPPNEPLSNTNATSFDFGAGLAYRWKKTERTNVTVGVGTAHLNNPSESFYNNGTVTLAPRLTLHARGQFQVSEKIDIVPEFMFQRQQDKQEFDLGGHIKYYLTSNSLHTIALNLGAYGRITDAGWLMAGVDYDNLQLNFSYDVNFTALTAASNYNGGFEVSVIYILARVKKINKPGAICPTLL